MSKEQLDFILKISAENPPPANASPPQLREWFEAINAQTPIADGAMIETISVGPCSAELIRLPGGDESRLVIYYHGGGSSSVRPARIAPSRPISPRRAAHRC